MKQTGFLTGNHQNIAKVNKALVLRYIKERGPISAPELAEILNLSTSTTMIYIRQALKDGLVQVDRIGQSSGGRKPTLFRFNPSTGVVLCMEIETSHILAAIVDFEGTIVNSVIHPISRSDPKTVIKESISLAKSLLLQFPNTKPILGIGVSCPGTVDFKEGVVVKAINLKWYEPVPLAAPISHALKLPVYVYNDAYAAALGEKYFGAGKNVHNLVYVMLETGIGAGLIVNDNIYSGTAGNAGNIGHSIVVKDGLACPCGNHGCLEAYCSEPAIVSRIMNIYLANYGPRINLDSLTQIRTLEQAIESANNGDQIAANALSEAGSYLGIALLNLAQILVPELIVMGELISLSNHIIQPVRDTLAQRFTYNLKIEVSTLGRKAKILGVATGLMERALGPSIIESRG